MFVLILAILVFFAAVVRAIVLPAPRRGGGSAGDNYCVGSPKFEYFEYVRDAPTYTIISNQTPHTCALVEEIKRHRVNFILIDMGHFSYDDLVKILKHYRDFGDTSPLPTHKEMTTAALIFMEDRAYIGGHFEMYQILARE